MKIKWIQIGIKTPREALQDFKDAFKKGQKAEKKEGLFFESVRALRSFLTPKRIELIKIIHHERPASAYALAKKVERDLKSVMTDLRILKSLGLIDLQKDKEVEVLHPMVDYDALRVEIAV